MLAQLFTTLVADAPEFAAAKVLTPACLQSRECCVQRTEQRACDRLLIMAVLLTICCAHCVVFAQYAGGETRLHRKQDQLAHFALAFQGGDSESSSLRFAAFHCWLFVHCDRLPSPVFVFLLSLRLIAPPAIMLRAVFLTGCLPVRCAVARGDKDFVPLAVLHALLTGAPLPARGAPGRNGSGAGTPHAVLSSVFWPASLCAGLLFCFTLPFRLLHAYIGSFPAHGLLIALRC